jgi:hypothetical protein
MTCWTLDRSVFEELFGKGRTPSSRGDGEGGVAGGREASRVDDGENQPTGLKILPVDYIERLQETAERNTRYRATCVPSVAALKSSTRATLARRVRTCHLLLSLIFLRRLRPLHFPLHD